MYWARHMGATKEREQVDQSSGTVRARARPWLARSDRWLSMMPTTGVAFGHCHVANGDQLLGVVAEGDGPPHVAGSHGGSRLLCQARCRAISRWPAAIFPGT